MLVTAYLMVGQKALFTAIRLYASSRVLLGGVAIVIGLTEHRPHLLASAALTIVLKGIVIPWFLMRVIDRIGIHREIEPILNVPSSLLICLGPHRGRLPRQHRAGRGRRTAPPTTSSGCRSRCCSWASS